MLDALLILALIHRAVCPGFLAMAMLGVSVPVPFVNAPVAGFVPAFAIGSVSDPLACVHISACVREGALPVSMVVFEFSFVHGPVFPLHFALAVPEAAFPLARVLGSRTLVLVSFSGHSWLLRVVARGLGNGFPELRLSQVLLLARFLDGFLVLGLLNERSHEGLHQDYTFQVCRILFEILS